MRSRPPGSGRYPAAASRWRGRSRGPSGPPGPRPTACPARNAVSISVNAYVVSSVTAASSPRVQSSSYASPQKPENARDQEHGIPRRPRRRPASRRIDSSSRATVIDDRRSHASAIAPTPRSTNAATRLVSTTPSQKIKTQPVTQQPMTAPAVLAAYSVPAVRPGSDRPAAANRVRTGRVPPIRRVGGPEREHRRQDADGHSGRRRLAHDVAWPSRRNAPRPVKQERHRQAVKTDRDLHQAE